MQKAIRKPGPGQLGWLARVVVLVVVLAVSGCASLYPHPRRWTGEEKALAGFFVLAHVMDGYTTERCQDHPERFYEVNPLLGKHPEDSEIALYFSVTGVGALVLAHLYPELRVPLLGGYGALNFGCTVYNYRLLSR